MSDLRTGVGELQRIVGQVEGAADEARDYPAEDRAAIAAALTDLACRLELCRCAIVDLETLPLTQP